MLGWNYQICGDRGKTVRFTDVAQIREFCESRNARQKIDSHNDDVPCCGLVECETCCPFDVCAPGILIHPVDVDHTLDISHTDAELM